MSEKTGLTESGTGSSVFFSAIEKAFQSAGDFLSAWKGYIAGFSLGVVFAVFLGNIILVSDLVPAAQNLAARINNLPPSLEGYYYYVTVPQNADNLPVISGNMSNIRAIGGLVQIQHYATIINPSIYFIGGERVLFISGDKIHEFPIHVTWNTRWAHIGNHVLRAYIEMGDHIKILLEGPISRKLEGAFSANLLYVPENQAAVNADIKFYKCEPNATFESGLQYELDKINKRPTLASKAAGDNSLIASTKKKRRKNPA